MLSLKTKLFALVFLTLFAIQTNAQQPQQLPVEITKKEFKKAIFIYSDSLSPNELLIGKGYAVIADLQVKVPADPIKGTKEQIQRGRETIAIVDHDQKQLKQKIVWISVFHEWPNMREENEGWLSRNMWYLILGIVIIVLLYLQMKRKK